MGTSLASLLVRSLDQSLIRGAIERSLRRELVPWSPSDDLHDNRTFAVLVDTEWTVVLDSRHEIDELAAAISDDLSCPTVSAWVRKSDYWGYRFFASGSLVDSFDSRETGADIASALGALDVNEILRRAKAGEDIADVGKDVRERLGIPNLNVRSLEEVQSELDATMKRLEGDVPEDFRLLGEKVEKGLATQEETRKFDQWMGGRASEINRVLFKDPFAEFPSPVPEKDIEAHVKKLRPILPADVDDTAAVGILAARYAAADVGLAEFVRMLGVDAALAATTVDDIVSGDAVAENVLLRLVWRVGKSPKGYSS